MNSLRSKYAIIKETVKDDIDFFLLREIKLAENFPNKHFEMQSYKTFCQNRNKHGGGVMFYVNENIPCRVLNIDFNFNDLETIFLKFYLRNRKCLCVSSYKRNQNDQYFLDYINKSLTKFSYQFDTTMLLEDFTLTTEN